MARVVELMTNGRNTMTRKVSAMLLTAGISMFCMLGTACAEDVASRFIGAWKLDVDKTQSHGKPVYKYYDVAITDAGAGKIKSAVKWGVTDGTTGQLEYTGRVDGTASPVTGDPDVDTAKMTQGKRGVLHLSLFKDGKMVEWGRYKVAMDGKTLSGTEGGTDEKGVKYRWPVVFERQ